MKATTLFRQILANPDWTSVQVERVTFDGKSVIQFALFEGDKLVDCREGDE